MVNDVAKRKIDASIIIFFGTSSVKHDVANWFLDKAKIMERYNMLVNAFSDHHTKTEVKCLSVKMGPRRSMSTLMDISHSMITKPNRYNESTSADKSGICKYGERH